MAFLGIKVFLFFLSQRTVSFLSSLINSSLVAAHPRLALRSPSAASGLVTCTCAGLWASSQLSGATAWRRAHWGLQRSELKNDGRFHFPASCSFRCLWRQARPGKRRGGGRERKAQDHRRSPWKYRGVAGKCRGMCGRVSQTQYMLLGASFKISLQWLPMFVWIAKGLYCMLECGRTAWH